MTQATLVNPSVEDDPALSLVEGLPIAVTVHDETGRLLRCNASARDLLDVSAPEQFEQLTFLRGDGSKLPASEHPVARVLESGAPLIGLSLGIQRATDISWVLVGSGLHLASGNAKQVVVSYVDITERKRAELALKDSETRYRTLFESMDAAVLLMKGAECIECNAATLELFGVGRREDILGKTPLDFAPEYQPNGMSSAEMVQRNVELAIRNGTHVFEWLSARASGEPIMMEVRFTPFALGDGDLFQCIAIDISERKKAEEALRQSESRFRAIIEGAAEGIMVADASTKTIRYANPEACKMFGYAPEELTGLQVTALHPAAAAGRANATFEAQARGERLEAQLSCVRKDGSMFEANVRGIPVEIDGVPCMVGFFKDETTSRLLDAEREKTQKLEALGTLAGGIAHDFNNLLQGVFGFIGVAKELSGRPEASVPLLEQAESALQRTIALTTQLLTFSRGGSPVKHPLALRNVVGNAARFALSGSRVTHRLDVAPDLWLVEADEGQVGQVVQNIVLNAAQSMPFGGHVDMSLRNVRASEEGRPPQLPAADYVAMTIRDHGTGIAPEILSRIFDPYFTTKEHGSGLGLASSYSIVKSHGGFIHVASEPDQGSTFTVYLPSIDTRAEAAAEPRPGGNLAASRVLVMDDDAMVRKSVAALIGVLGHEVEMAEHGAAAVEKYQEARRQNRPFDVVILDLTVRGGMGGLEALARLREVDPQVRAIVSSGYSDDASVSQFREHGFHAALNKPYSLDDLTKALCSVLTDPTRIS